MISSQVDISRLANRIEKAYSRKNPSWLAIGMTPGVWAAAAARLLEAGEGDRDFPIDPELFVAVQDGGRLRLDPWMELAQPRSLQKYRKAIKRIVAQLRGELRGELRRAGRRLLGGESFESLMANEETRISPLSCFIMAHQAGRLDLALLSRPLAKNQDRSCPLYRLASRGLLPAHLYPAAEEVTIGEVETGRKIAFSLN